MLSKGFVFGLLAVLLQGCMPGSVNPSETLYPVLPTSFANIPESTPIETPYLTKLPETESIAEKESPQAIFIPSGSFNMGAEAEIGLAICEESRPGCSVDDFVDEEPVHEVFLDGYWIDTYEVNTADYKSCVEAGECSLPALTEFYYHPDFADHPVVYVSWYQAAAYCIWVGGSLPTEAQWEKVARGEEGRIFAWGDEMICGMANIKGCTEGLTYPSGSFPDGASPYGVMDMSGNAAEWVADWYDRDYYANSPSRNPAGPESGELKVARGGSWKNPFSGVRVTNRTANFPEIYSSGVGFRCVYAVQP